MTDRAEYTKRKKIETETVTEALKIAEDWRRSYFLSALLLPISKCVDFENI